MLEKYINRLAYLCEVIPIKLFAIDESEFSARPIESKWSKKEIIGHLIDSATNNHRRFIRGQFEEIPTITYHPDQWNKFNYYSQMPGTQIIQFWEMYNMQILSIIRLIPEENLHIKVNTGGETSFSIAYLFNDYIDHMEHHLKQVIEY